MTLKTFKPYTKSTRGTILVEKSELWKGKPFKSLVYKKKKSHFIIIKDFKYNSSIFNIIYNSSRLFRTSSICNFNI